MSGYALFGAGMVIGGALVLLAVVTDFGRRYEAVWKRQRTKKEPAHKRAGSRKKALK